MSQSAMCCSAHAQWQCVCVVFNPPLACCRLNQNKQNLQSLERPCELWVQPRFDVLNTHTHKPVCLESRTFLCLLAHNNGKLGPGVRRFRDTEGKVMIVENRHVKHYYMFDFTFITYWSTLSGTHWDPGECLCEWDMMSLTSVNVSFSLLHHLSLDF